MNITEKWRIIRGTKKCFEISSYGQVRSIARWISWWNGYSQCKKWLPSITRKQFTFRVYPSVRLDINGKSKTCFVHHLVLEHFVGPRPKGMEARHKDDNPENNRLDNLRWSSHKKNISDIWKNKGIHHACKLNEIQVIQIRELYKKGVSCIKIAQQLNSNQSTVRDIAFRRTWRHI